MRIHIRTIATVLELYCTSKRAAERSMVLGKLYYEKILFIVTNRKLNNLSDCPKLSKFYRFLFVCYIHTFHAHSMHYIIQSNFSLYFKLLLIRAFRLLDSQLHRDV